MAVNLKSVGDWSPSTVPAKPLVSATGLETIVDVSQSNFPWNWKLWQLEYQLQQNPIAQLYEGGWELAFFVEAPESFYKHSLGSDAEGYYIFYRYRIYTGSSLSTWSNISDVQYLTSIFVPPVGGGDVKSVSKLVGNGTARVYTLQHNLGVKNVNILVYETSTGEVVYPTITIKSLTTVDISFSKVVSQGQYTAVFVG